MDVTPSPTRRLGSRFRMLVAAAVAAVGIFALAAPASAANYDGTGVPVNYVRASASVSMQCGTLSGTLFYNPGAVRPAWYRWTAYNLGTGASWGSQWYAGGGTTNQRIITQPGNYLVTVTIASPYGTSWVYDTEYTFVTNDFPYDRQGACHVGR